MPRSEEERRRLNNIASAKYRRRNLERTREKARERMRRRRLAGTGKTEDANPQNSLSKEPSSVRATTRPERYKTSAQLTCGESYGLARRGAEMVYGMTSTCDVDELEGPSQSNTPPSVDNSPVLPPLRPVYSFSPQSATHASSSSLPPPPPCCAADSNEMHTLFNRMYQALLVSHRKEVAQAEMETARLRAELERLKVAEAATQDKVAALNLVNAELRAQLAMCSSASKK